MYRGLFPRRTCNLIPADLWKIPSGLSGFLMGHSLFMRRSDFIFLSLPAGESAHWKTTCSPWIQSLLMEPWTGCSCPALITETHPDSYCLTVSDVTAPRTAFARRRRGSHGEHFLFSSGVGSLNKLVQEVSWRAVTSGETAPGSGDHTLGDGYCITSMNVLGAARSTWLRLRCKKTKP